MQFAPKIPSKLFSTPTNVVNAFVKLREVTGDVACVDLGRKGLDYYGVLSVSTVNFSLMSEEDQETLIESFKGFLNGLAFPIQILIRNLPHNLDSYLRSLESIEGDMAETMHDHAAFVRQLASRRALVKREFYIIVLADHQATRNNARNRTEALINAQMQIKLRVDEIVRQLERLGLSGRRLTSIEIVRLYQSCLNPPESQRRPLTEAMLDGAREGMMVVDRRQIEDSVNLEPQYDEDTEIDVQQAGTKKKQKKRKSGQEASLPAFVNVPDLVTPSSIEVFPTYVRIDGEVEHEYARTLILTSYPRSGYPGWLDSIVQVDEPYIDFSIHITPLSPEQVNARLARKAVEFRGSVIVAQRQGRNPDPTASIALQDVEQLRENLARGDERVFNITVSFLVRAKDRQELMERSNRIVSVIRSLDFRALPAQWQHHLGFLSCLPQGFNPLGRGRLFGTSSASTFFPFTGSEIGMDSGVMFGAHPNGGLIILNPFNSNQLENANLVVFAKSGAGKSFFLKTVSCRLLPMCDIYVVDPEAEYNNLCDRVKGQYVRLSSESLQINPLELYGQAGAAYAPGHLGKEEMNFFREKLLNLITLLELLLSDEGSLTQKEKGFLYKCLLKTYENRGITMDPATHGRVPPNMHEFYVIMSSTLRGDNRFGVGADTHGLSERMERYLHLFPARTRVVLDNKFVDFNIRELNDALKPVGLFLITEFLWTKMRQTRQGLSHRNSIVLIDEAWLLMRFKQGAKFLEEFARRIRKYGGGLWCTTQNSGDFLGSEEGKTILAMATMKFLMKQDTTTIDSVMDTFHLSVGQRNFLLAARRGEGLFATRNWTQMEVLASPKEVQMANTTLNVQLVNEQQQQAVIEKAEDLERLAELEREMKNGSGPQKGLSSDLISSATIKRIEYGSKL